jgi:hypothetical protein
MIFRVLAVLYTITCCLILVFAMGVTSGPSIHERLETIKCVAVLCLAVGSLLMIGFILYAGKKEAQANYGPPAVQGSDTSTWAEGLEAQQKRLSEKPTPEEQLSMIRYSIDFQEYKLAHMDPGTSSYRRTQRELEHLKKQYEKLEIITINRALDHLKYD